MMQSHHTLQPFGQNSNKSVEQYNQSIFLLRKESYQKNSDYNESITYRFLNITDLVFLFRYTPFGLMPNLTWSLSR